MLGITISVIYGSHADPNTVIGCLKILQTWGERGNENFTLMIHLYKSYFATIFEELIICTGAFITCYFNIFKLSYVALLIINVARFRHFADRINLLRLPIKLLSKFVQKPFLQRR